MTTDPKTSCCSTSTSMSSSIQRLAKCHHFLLWWTVFLRCCELCSSSVTSTLPIGDINVVVLTDVHSWLGGHGYHDPGHNADYGDVLSFFNHFKNECNCDAWLVMNGDWVDGTGLSVNGDVSELVPLIQRMPWDAINVGNHELYKSSLIDYISRPAGFIEWWEDSYLSSNTIRAGDGKPLGNRFTLLKGKDYTLLTFGFLYNMEHYAENVVVEKVEDVVKSRWFRRTLRSEEYDAILVLAHMDADHPLVHTILSAIREEAGHDMPVQFLTGHTHYRRYFDLDINSKSVEAGRYLDTVGFVSFPAKQNIGKNVPIAATEAPETTDPNATAAPATTTSFTFQHVFLEANKPALREALGGVSSLATAEGTRLSKFIQRAREDMGLDQVVGCTPNKQSYILNTSMAAEDSLWGLFQRQVVPSQLLDDRMLLFMGKGGLRFDLPSDHVRLDDIYGVSPFNETIRVIGDSIPGSVVLTLNSTLNKDLGDYYPFLPNYVLSGRNIDNIQSNEGYTLATAAFEAENLRVELQKIYGGDLEARDTDMTTTSIWFYFVSQKWGCKEAGGIFPWLRNNLGEDADSDTRVSAIGQIIAVLALICVVLAGIVAWRRTGGRAHGITLPNEFDDMDTDQDNLNRNNSTYRDSDNYTDDDTGRVAVASPVEDSGELI